MKSKIHELTNFKNKVVSKTFKKLGKVLIAALIVIAGFASCEKSDLKPEAPLVKMEESSPIVEQAIWRIASFQWHNRENNDHFKDYIFRFDAQIPPHHPRWLVKESFHTVNAAKYIIK